MPNAQRANILVINDDGLLAPGLVTLVGELARQKRFDIRVVAPEREQSGVGHGLTLHEPLFAEPAALPGELASIPAFKISGTPADCVKLALSSLFPDFRPDLVLSGINRGPNVGILLVYSGTVAGAREGTINGYPSIALSLDIPRSGQWHFAFAAEKTITIVDAVLSHGLPNGIALNVNFPDATASTVRGMKVTKQGVSGFFEQGYEEGEAMGARRRFRLEGELRILDPDESFDMSALRAGWITVTPIGLAVERADVASQIQKMPIFTPAIG